ncbi:MAG: amidohydrolase family protein [Chloroflexi bacterium]|nr:amidohydrolase family protein [Chloroflexota bacterium]
MTILDPHVHTWVYPDHFPGDAYLKFSGARERGLTDAQIKQANDRRADRILREMGEAGVDKAVVVGFKGGTTLGQEVPNEFIAKEVKPHPGKLYWVCAVNLIDPNAPAEVERCVKELGAIGLGEIGPGYGHFSVDDERCFPVYEVCRSLDVPISIHAGPAAPRNTHIKYGNLEALDEVCVNFPELKVVLCHFGEPHYEEAAHLMAKHPNLYADVSMMPSGAGLWATRPAPPVLMPFLHLDLPLLNYFSMPSRSHNKLLWASDVQHPKESMAAFRGVNQRLKERGYPTIPENFMENIFHENWKQVFTKIKV